MVYAPDELTKKYGAAFSGEIVHQLFNGIPYNWHDFELILPSSIAPKRLLLVLKDLKPKHRNLY